LPEDLRATLATTVIDPASSEAAARPRMVEAARGGIEQQLDSYESGPGQDWPHRRHPEEVGRVREAKPDMSIIV
jgi:hypothetical protein